MIHQLVYTSRLDPGINAADLLQISDTSSSRNAAHDITGMMLTSDHMILQVLEGPKTQVGTLFDNIRHDFRHTEIRVMAVADAKARAFDGQAMVLKFVRTAPGQDAFQALIAETISARRLAA